MTQHVSILGVILSLPKAALESMKHEIKEVTKLNESSDERRIEELDISFRTYSRLRHAGIMTVAQLVSTPEIELRKIGGIGGVYWPGFMEELEINGLKIEGM